jgi:predicted secreted acid phosphatase
MEEPMPGFDRPRRSRRLLVVPLALALSFVLGGVVVAAVAQPAIKTFTPKSEKQITNIDVLRQQIRNYYGDPLGTGVFADDGKYAKEASRVAHDGTKLLDRLAGKHSWSKHWSSSKQKAIILDVDDTSLATWNYEIFSNWAYNQGTNATYVTGQLFPAVPGMVELANEAASDGYAIIFLTGRPQTQEAATLGNLTSDGVGVDAGFPMPTTLNDGEDGLFTKPAVADYPDYLKTACADEIAAGKSCTTIHYKSATRQHIESLGYDIVANFGDQFSDLKGGFADHTFKLPNPNYFLP